MRIMLETLYLTIHSSLINFKKINYMPIHKRVGEKTLQDRVSTPGINHPELSIY